MKLLLFNLLQETEIIEKILTPIDYAFALWWTLLGIIFIKLLIYPRKVKFNGKVWIEENTQDVLIGLVACLIIMQLGAIVLNLVTVVTGFDMSGIQTTLEKLNLNPIKLSLVLSMVIQWKLYKAYRHKNK